MPRFLLVPKLCLGTQEDQKKGKQRMPDMKSTLSRWSPHALSVLRIVAGFLFIEHGSQKLFAMPAGPSATPVELVSIIGLAGILEFFCGVFVMLGLFTRTAAFVASGEMAVAYFWKHALQGYSPLMNHGELAVIYCFVFLYIASAGGGPWSLDHLRKRNPFLPH
jgi:putative oxidoreductase